MGIDERTQPDEVYAVIRNAIRDGMSVTVIRAEVQAALNIGLTLHPAPSSPEEQESGNQEAYDPAEDDMARIGWHARDGEITPTRMNDIEALLDDGAFIDNDEVRALLALAREAEQLRRGIKYAKFFFDSPGSFSDDEFRAVANEVYAASRGTEVQDVYTGRVPHLQERCDAAAQLTLLREGRDGLEDQVRRLTEAINWACGCGSAGEFSDYDADDNKKARYWWRSELTKLAGLTWSPEKLRYILAPTEGRGGMKEESDAVNK